MNNDIEADLEHKKEIQNILNYFVKEGIVEEVAPGEYNLTASGKKVVEIPL